MNKSSPVHSRSPSELIDRKIAGLGGWRGKTLSRMRKLIKEADPDIVEECKWIKPSKPSRVPVLSHAGIVCTGESYKTTVKLTFAKGAALQDSAQLWFKMASSRRAALTVRTIRV